MPTARRIRTPAAYAKKFSGKYAHRLITGGIGHNLPQEAPQAFAEAVIDVADELDRRPDATDSQRTTISNRGAPA